MELLVVTVARTAPGKEVEVNGRMRLIADNVKNAPGLTNARIYRSRENQAHYFILTAWEDEEWWQKAQERHSPRRLLMDATNEVLTAAPEQWRMRYLWGYSRPAAEQTVAAMHIASVRREQVEVAQRGWIEGLRRLSVLPTLAFAMLARSLEDGEQPQNGTRPGRGSQEGAIAPDFLNLLSWPDETQREDFYTDPDYKAVHSFLKRAGSVNILELEPL